MIPTYGGRIQTRIFLVVFIGLPWTLFITPFLPGRRTGMSFTDIAADRYPATLLALAVVLVLGIGLWEHVYHFFQQYRWEKDWPVMFALFEVIPEAILAWFVFTRLVPDSVTTANGWTFATHIVSTWLVMWLFVLGPIKVLFIRWRFNGGRIFF
jgi:hypothetical protein